MFAIESGSRAWNIQSKDSDYDVRGFYVEDGIKDYLHLGSGSSDLIEFEKELTPARLTMFYQGGPRTKSLVGTDIDIRLWDVKKYLFLASKGNAQPREWRDSPIRYVMSKRGRRIVKKLPLLWNPNSYTHHYISLAKNNYNRYIEGEGDSVEAKKYIYITRAICQARRIWKKEGQYVFTSFDLEKISENIQDPVARDQFINILEAKVNGKELEGVKRERFSELEDWIVDNIENGRDVCDQMPTGRDDKFEKATELFHKTLQI